jgi:hypothetical protein
MQMFAPVTSLESWHRAKSLITPPGTIATVSQSDPAQSRATSRPIRSIFSGSRISVRAGVLLFHSRCSLVGLASRTPRLPCVKIALAVNDTGSGLRAALQT